MVAARTWPYFCFWIVWLGALLHLGWALIYAISPDAQGSTQLHGVVRGMDQLGVSERYLVVLALVCASLLALSVIFTDRNRTVWTILALLPQQVFLLMSSWSSIAAIFRGMYSDGVLRPWPFIAADQLPAILAAAVYTVAIFSFHTWTARWRR